MVIRALLNTVMGMGTAFVVLTFISFIISLFKYIPAIQEKFSKKDAQPVPTTKPVPKKPPVVEEEEVMKEEVTKEEEELVDDAQLVAVITAAIMASRQATNAISADKLVVRSIRRAKKRS